MEVSRVSVLSKTVYGLKIYAHILREFYPEETVLSVAGKDCKPTKNPFNQNQSTLKIQIENGCANHFDLENSIFKGDAFDFAALHFGLGGQELLEKLNEVLSLRIDKPSGFYVKDETIVPIQAPPPLKISIPTFSYFKAPVTNPYPAGEVNFVQLLKVLKGNRFLWATKTLRNIQDKKEAKKFKAKNFDYVTFSGSFSYRNENSLLKHSGLLVVDLDHVESIDTLKARLLQDEYFETELLFTSPSGDGLKWVIPIDITRHKHLDYFNAIANYIRQTYKVEMDPSGKDVSRACFLANDPQAFLNPKYL
jgi:hypothetical protein